MSLRVAAHLGMALAALFCALFAFSASLDVGFSGDDLRFLERALTATSLWDEPWAGAFERPLAQLLLHGQITSWGLEASRYTLSHALLHAANATLLFALFRGPLGFPVAASAAILFALGLGFYGESLWRPSQLAILLATAFALSTGIVALRAQLERTPTRRLVATLLSALLFTLALCTHEAGVMALVMLGGLMWPHRRSLSSVLRKLALLVVLGAAAVAWQILRDHAAVELLLQGSTWINLPVRVLRLLSLMVLPLTTQIPEPEATSLFSRFLTMLEQTRPFSGLLLLLGMGFWFFRGSGALRWLMASYLAFLVPAALRPPTEARLDLGEAYLAAAFFAGIVALGFYQLWHRAPRAYRLLLAILLVALLYADLALVRRGAEISRTIAERPENQRLRQQLDSRFATPP